MLTSLFCRFFQKKFNKRCSCTGHFYRGKWPFYSGKLAWCVWRDCPEINLPWGISMVTSKRRKKPPMTFNVVNSWGLWIPKPNKANQVSSFNTNMKPQKIEIIFRHFWLILPFCSSFVSVVGAYASFGCVCYDECCRGQ